MAKLRPGLEQPRESKTDAIFMRADKLEANGNLKGAFRLFLAAAKAGDSGCQLNVGNYYCDGKGIRPNLSVGLYWYKRAYRRGEASAAHNIGITWRNAGSPRRALSWFKRAVKMGDDEANLEIAKYFLGIENSLRKAIPHLEKVCRSNRVTEAGAQEAANLLKQARKKLKQR
jgi:TPR repeat protein